MFCAKCGNEMKAGEKFCSRCGAKQETGMGFQADADMKAEPGRNVPADAGAKAKSEKKGRAGLVVLAVALVLVAGAVLGGVLYVNSDGYRNKKYRKVTEECFQAETFEEIFSELDSILTQAYVRSADNYLLQEKFAEAYEILEKGLKSTQEKKGAQEIIAAKTEEVKLAEIAAEVRKFQEYLDQELAPQYGYADLSAQKRTFDWDASFSENWRWTGVLGIAAAEISDLDGDGRIELLTITLEEENTYLRIYELENGIPVVKAEVLEDRFGDMFAFDVDFSMVEGGGIKYLFFRESSLGVLSDGYFAKVKLYHYDGANLYTPLAVLQTGGGSIDFVFTAYQYDESGNLLTEEVIYDEVYDHVNYDSAHCYERTADLFGIYGLVLNSEAAINEGKDIFDDIAAYNVHQNLLSLSMWGVYQGEDVIYHFNDWDSPVLAYESFLRGERTLHGGENDWWLGEKQGADLTYQEVLAQVTKTYQGYYGGTISPAVQYVFLDCGGDGREELLLSFSGLGCTLEIVIGYKAGALEVIYSAESGEESYTDIDYYGIATTHTGDNLYDIYESFGDGIKEVEYINGDDVVQTVYTYEKLWGRCIRKIAEEAYDEAFKDFPEDPGIYIDVYNIAGSVYYQSYLFGDCEQECEEFISLCQTQGMVFMSSWEEINEILTQRIAETGIQSEWEAIPYDYIWKRFRPVRDNLRIRISSYRE